MDAKPTHEQAQLHLQIYDMRRETRLREAREWFYKNYLVENLDDWMRIAAPGTPTGAFSMMVLTYWDQACAMLNYVCFMKTFFLRPAGSFSESLRGSSPSFRRLGNGFRISISSGTWKKPRSAMKSGWRTALPAI